MSPFPSKTSWTCVSMTNRMTTAPQPNLHAAPFHTTRWTRVCLAKADSEDSRRALADLCDACYEPVVAYLRSVFRDADAAREMSHAFFAEMLGGGTIHTAERERGRFRSYLLGAVKHFVTPQHKLKNSLSPFRHFIGRLANTCPPNPMPYSKLLPSLSMTGICWARW